MVSFTTPIFFGDDDKGDKVFDALCTLEEKKNAGSLSRQDLHSFVHQFAVTDGLSQQPSRSDAIPHGYFHNGKESDVIAGGFEEALLYKNHAGQLEALIVSSRSCVIVDPATDGLLWLDVNAAEQSVQPVYLGLSPDSVKFEVFTPSKEATAKIKHVREDHLTGRCHSCANLPVFNPKKGLGG